MFYRWFTGITIINWPLRKIVTLFLRPLWPYGNQDLLLLSINSLIWNHRKHNFEFIISLRHEVQLTFLWKKSSAFVDKNYTIIRKLFQQVCFKQVNFIIIINIMLDIRAKTIVSISSDFEKKIYQSIYYTHTLIAAKGILCLGIIKINRQN